MNEDLIKTVCQLKYAASSAAKWIFFGIASGVVIGSIGAALYMSIYAVTALRDTYRWIIYMLPAGGALIVFCYHKMNFRTDQGTSFILEAIREGENVPLRMAPLIFAATVITHLFGGSAGREGAALQLGGSIGNVMGKVFRFDEEDRAILIMCGMSAAFSSVFNTPMAAAILSMEIGCVGLMYYSALVPCVISSITAHLIAVKLGITAVNLTVFDIPEFTVMHAVFFAFFSACCALVSIFFCIVLRKSERYFKKYFDNEYVRIMLGGCMVLILTLIVGNQSYNGTGVTNIKACLEGDTVPYAFLLKILFTAITLGSGYKGGEIIPSLYIGASFGCMFGNLTGFAPSLCAAVGMGTVFCSVTNCPITSLLICLELFGFDGAPYYLLAITLAYMLSGNYGAYRGQIIMYSKFRNHCINENVH